MISSCHPPTRHRRLPQDTLGPTNDVVYPFHFPQGVYDGPRGGCPPNCHKSSRRSVLSIVNLVSMLTHASTLGSMEIDVNTYFVLPLHGSSECAIRYDVGKPETPSGLPSPLSKYHIAHRTLVSSVGRRLRFHMSEVSSKRTNCTRFATVRGTWPVQRIGGKPIKLDQPS